MDISKTRQRYKQYACLCFSVMGQRKFRVSMGVLIASPESGDASVNIIPHMKKYNAISDEPSKSFISTISEKNITNRSALGSSTNYDCSNTMIKDSHKQMIFMENDVSNKMNSSTIPESCQFPYYRSNKSDSECLDAVLVKDVGVSCMLSQQNISELSLPDTGTIIKELKKECSDLSNITNKITTYTKDILHDLTMKKQRKHCLLKDLVSSKHAIASQYTDSRGNLCLKLRLFNHVQTQCASQQALKNHASVLCKDKNVVKKVRSKSKNRISDRKEKPKEENIKSKYEKEVQTIICKNNAETNTSCSASPSTSSIFNYLMVRKQKSSNELLNCRLLKLGNTQKQRDFRSFSDNNDHKDHLKRCSPIIFTNWREISQLKKCRNKTLSITSTEAQQTADIKKKSFGKEFVNNKTIGNTPEARFHTVNIRIIKQNKKHF